MAGEGQSANFQEALRGNDGGDCCVYATYFIIFIAVDSSSMPDKSVAVIINGCVRPLRISEINRYLEDFTEYKRVIEHINILLKDFQTVHIYYHTWDPMPATNIPNAEYAYNKDKLIRELSDLSNIKQLIFEEPYTSSYLDSINAKYVKSIIQQNFIHKASRTSIYSVFKAYSTLSNTVIASGIHYDYILRMRNDVLIDFSDFQTVLTKADEHYLCLPPNCWSVPKDKWYSETNRINDHWLFGLSNYVIPAICYSSLDEFTEIVGASHDAEELTGTYIHRVGRPLYIIPVSSYLLLNEYRKFI